ncbi:MAG: enoyl-ACP reductase [Chloroflexota bacterium]|nr:enoyl-ACP reductase [Dehalococcoidia bacterium]MDW8254156.1 enoyl-ACP reductase [Chloroflexota bacterium]
MTGLLAGKIALILGVANRFSIAWPIAQAFHREGARIIMSYQGERVERAVRQLADSLDGALAVPCDVNDDQQIDALFAAIDREVGGLDAVVHSIAYAPTEALDGPYLATSRDAFRLALEVSVYSLTAIAQRAAPRLEARGGGSLLTLTYLGGERVVPHYNVMGVAKAALDMSVRYLAADLGPKGIRVNAISAGPISTASSRAIKGFLQMAHRVAEAAPLRRTTSAEEVADTAVYLASHLGRGVTGEVIHVDSGYHVLGAV